MTDFVKDKTVKYLNKDFQSFKRDLIQFTQAHHSGVFQDFNESSPGMVILELQAYIGDVLSFYLDNQFNELKQESARQISNVTSFAKGRGYRPSGKSAAQGDVSFFIEVPATTRNGARVPNDSYSPILRKGARVQGPNGTTFETLDDVPFSASNLLNPRTVTGSILDGSGLPTHFAIRKTVAVMAGETKTETIDIGDFQRFKTIELSEPDVIEVLSVTDSDGNDWTEVDFLAQESVFDSTVNSSEDNDVVPYILKLKTVPRRFIIDRDPITNKTSLVFGSGDGINFDDELIPNLADMSLPLNGKDTFTNVSIDPQNFLKTRTLGLSPFSTTLTVLYRVGGGPQTNVPAGSIDSVINATLDFTETNLDVSAKASVVGSLVCINQKKTEGGMDEENIEEIKANSAAFFAAQNRVVTREDFMARVMSLPAKFGRPSKVYVSRNPSDPQANDIRILTIDADGHFANATSTLKNNIKSYLSKFRMLSDGVNILDANVINLGIDFGVVVSPKFNRTEVLTKCINVLRDYFLNDKVQIAQPIVISDVESRLQQVLGVISVYKLQFRNLFGLSSDNFSYSIVRFDVNSHVSRNILYCPDDSVFEIKFPSKDISGESA